MSVLILKKLPAVARMNLGNLLTLIHDGNSIKIGVVIHNSDRYCRLKKREQCSYGGSNGKGYLCIVKRHFRFCRQDLLPLLFSSDFRDGLTHRDFLSIN